MTTCDPALSDDICPGIDLIQPQLLALLPRGRAWSTHDGGPWPGQVLYQFWRAVASVFAYANERICALREEFFCATQFETRDIWMAQYGLPDGCDPYPDLCAKAAAQGGSRCEYFTAIAARAGWRIACLDHRDPCGSSLGFDTAGCFVPGGGGGAAGGLIIQVISGQSPVVAQTRGSRFIAGCSAAGEPLGCDSGGSSSGGSGGSLDPLICLLSRILPAHAQVTYEVVL